MWQAQSPQKEVVLHTTQSQAVGTPCHRRVQVLEFLWAQGVMKHVHGREIHVIEGLENIWGNITLCLTHFYVPSQAFGFSHWGRLG